jgi:hypothetical protein
MAAPNDTEEERRVGGGKGLFCFSCAAAIMDLSYLSPSSQKNPFLEGNSKIKRLNDGKTLTGEKETNK